MAMVFDSADGDGADYLENTSLLPSLTLAPLTLACWVNPDSTADWDGCITIAQAAVANQLFALTLNTSGEVAALVRQLGAASSVVGTYTAGSWNHAAAVFASSTSRTAYLDGTAGTENTTSKTPAAVDTMQMGEWASTTTRPLDGKMAECAIWNAALTTGEIQAMANGLSPSLIRPHSIISYYPLVRDYVDIYGNHPVTPNNTVVWGDHPRVIEGAPQTHRSAWGGL